MKMEKQHLIYQNKERKMFIKIEHENGYLYLDLEFVNQINCNIKEEMMEIIYKNQQQIMKYKPTNFTKTIEELDKCSIVKEI